MKKKLAFNFKDSEGRFAISINSKQVAYLLKQCADAGEYETGGILIGYYNETLDSAIVTRIINAPPDSRRGRTWFHRGISGLQALISKLWLKQQHYYLGEWHFHPSRSPEASGVDIQQMKKIASSSSYQCPEPILLIVGDNPKTSWSVQVTVFRRVSERPVELT